MNVEPQGQFVNRLSRRHPGRDAAWYQQNMINPVPVVAKNMSGGRGRLFWAPRGSQAIAGETFGGRRTTMARLALETGLSKRSVQWHLYRMAALGLGVLSTVRGRYGWTRFLVQKDVTFRIRVVANADGTQGWRDATVFEMMEDLRMRRAARGEPEPERIVETLELPKVETLHESMVSAFARLNIALPDWSAIERNAAQMMTKKRVAA